jgi:hypothetical protein
MQSTKHFSKFDVVVLTKTDFLLQTSMNRQQPPQPRRIEAQGALAGQAHSRRVPLGAAIAGNKIRGIRAALCRFRSAHRHRERAYIIITGNRNKRRNGVDEVYFQQLNGTSARVRRQELRSRKSTCCKS